MTQRFRDEVPDIVAPADEIRAAQLVVGAIRDMSRSFPIIPPTEPTDVSAIVAALHTLNESVKALTKAIEHPRPDWKKIKVSYKRANGSPATAEIVKE